MNVVLDQGLLRQDMARRGLTIGELARRARLDRGTVAKAVGGGEVRVATAHRIGEALADSPVVEMPALFSLAQLRAAS